MSFRPVFIAVVIAFATLFERILSGAPPMAPLLFPNLVVLGVMALRVMAEHVQQHEGVVQ